MGSEATTTKGSEPICEVVAVHKAYGAVKALAGVDLAIHPGRVLAIVGENGAGKSTLMKVLAGAERPDEGQVLIRGEATTLNSTAEAVDVGIAIVFQELSLFPDLDVLSNLFLGRERMRFGLASRGAMRQIARPVLAELGATFSLDAPVSSLRLADRQLVEIARAALAGASVIVLDEPNSALNAVESDRLFALVRRLRDSGVAIVYVSHRLEEVLAIADDVVVMRDGLIVESVSAAATSISQIVTAMIGHAVPTRVQHRSTAQAAGPTLRVTELSVPGRLFGVSFEARPGEVLGLAGLDGAGVRVVYDVLFGMRVADGGSVSMPDGSSGPRGTYEAVRRGVAHVPGDRRAEGLLLDQSVAANLSLVVSGVLDSDRWVRKRKVAATAERLIRSLQIRTSSLDAPATGLSGGNQQKVVIGKWLAADPRVVLLDDPTRGVDVGSKQEIYGVIRRLADERRIVLFTSTELSEFPWVCDRVVVLYRGRVAGILSGAALTEHELLHAINTGMVPGVEAQSATSAAQPGE